jgi:hypothetical protein
MDMGNHTLNGGHRGEDGAIVAAPVVAPLDLSRFWQQPQDQVAELPLPPAPSAVTRWWHDGDKVIRGLTAAAVLAVAAIAAVVSYSHIFELGRIHGQDGTAARLLPLSVDGLIASASLVMLHAARKGIRPTREGKLRWVSWPRAMLALGVGATVAANVEYGLPFGMLAAVISAWPAVAFVGSVEMAIRLVSDARSAATGGETEPAPSSDDDSLGGDSGGDSEDPPDDVPDPAEDQHDERPEDDSDSGQKPGGEGGRRPRSGRDRARGILKRNPGLTNAEVARRAKVDVRTVQRARGDLATRE